MNTESLKELNVLSLNPFELISVSVSPSSSPTDAKKGIAQELDSSASGIWLWQVSPGVHLPESRSTGDMRATLPENAHLQELPRRWNLGVMFADSELHLVVASRQPSNVNVFDVHSKKLQSRTSTFAASVESLAPGARVYKCPMAVTCRTGAERSAAIVTIAALFQDLDGWTELDVSQRIIDVFPWGLPAAQVHFVVHTENSSDEDVAALPTPMDLATRRKKYFRSNSSKSPSSEAKNTQPGRAMMIGRPNESILPPSLLNETLSNLRHNVSYMSPTTQDFIDFYTLRNQMIRTFAKEVDRRTALIDCLSTILPSRPEPGVISSYTNDGQLAITISNIMYLYYLQEVKNELAGNSGEPNIEVTRYYIEQCGRCYAAGVEQHCNFPAILLCQLGPYLVVSSAVFTDVPIVEQLGCIPLHAHSTNMSQIEAGARAIGALRAASKDLFNSYPSLVTEVQGDFPFPRSFDLAGLSKRFRYTSAFDGKRVYRAAIVDSGAPVIVKYTLKYSMAAHKFANDAGFAPKLLDCKRIHEWWMVVMEDVSTDYVTIEQAKADGHDLHGIQDSVNTALHALHHANYVHGDIRDVNVLVRRDSNRVTAPVMLVDWDWAGICGEAVYPVTLNPAVLRPSGATAGAVIQASDDLAMVSLLLSLE
ncbi:hypothetical protein R3P38DRAFT_2698658 [Favolaschia claudopus]|uniref:Protein kinase domain-containing protein n=1 Tax=Favolaschia claudopus TaxID=2862362 RepID=A0AAW0C7J1_9AGAR